MKRISLDIAFSLGIIAMAVYLLLERAKNG